LLRPATEERLLTLLPGLQLIDRIETKEETMTTKIILATAVAVAVVAAVATGSASAASTAFKTCGTVNGGGATWTVVAAGVSCTVGKPLVRKLSAKPHPGIETRLGTYQGLKCVEITGQSKREIACISTNGRRSVYGVTPAKK
jgi:hypothetical protein